MDTENSDVDSKYSLVLVTASMMAYMIFAGSAKAFGTLYAELLIYFEDGAGNTAWIGSISNFTILALEFIQKLLREKKKSLAVAVNSTFRYIDDVLSINNDFFYSYVDSIYPSEIEIKDTTGSSTSASYLDILLKIDLNGKLTTQLYDKRDDFNFTIVNFPYLCNNIPSSPAYGVYVCQLIRYARACSAYDQFSNRGPLANHLCTIYTFRKVMFLGGILSSCGVLLTSFMPRIQWMYLTYGLLGGIGYGLQFSTFITVVNYYVKKRRALASGFIVSGSGVGLFILPHLYRILVEHYGLRGCFMVLSAINLHTCVAASLVRQPKSLIQKQNLKKEPNRHHCFKNERFAVTTCGDNLLDSSQNITKPSSCAFGFTFLDLSVFRITSLTVVTIAIFLHQIAYVGILTILPAHVIALGYAKKDADMILSLSGIVDILSKILFGVFADMISKQRRQHLLAITIFLSGVSTVLVSFFEWYQGLVIYSLSVGTFTAAFLSLISIVVIDIVGMERLPSTLGQIFFFLSISMLIGPPAAGWLKDVTGSWVLSFRVVGPMSITGGILIILNPFFAKYCAQHDYRKQVSVKGTTEEKELYL